MSDSENKNEVSIQSAKQISDVYIPVKEFNEGGSSADVIDQTALDDAWFFLCGDKQKRVVSDYPEVLEFSREVVSSLNSVKGGIASDDINDIQVKVEMGSGDEKEVSFCRVHKEAGTSYGVTFAIRIQPEVPPQTDEMTMPFMMYDLLMHPSMEKGGLIILVAGLGAGKTTTVSATVCSRLSQYGGLAVSIEDPPEHNLMGKNNGDWGKGKIIQKSVQTSKGESFSDAVRASLRMFPATPGNLLFLGEIRDADTAEQALSAAANGSLVLATVHGNDAASGLDRFLSYTVPKQGKELSYNMLRDCLRLTIFQNLKMLSDEAGEGDWGMATPRVEMIHNLLWKNKLKSEIEKGFDVDNGIKKGLVNVTDQQRSNRELGAGALNTSVNMIFNGSTPKAIVDRLSSDERFQHLNLKEVDFTNCCEFVAQNDVDEKTRKRLMRTNIEWQTRYEPQVFIDLRSRVVNAALEYYYERS